jgi:hypothetical protein
MKKYITVLCGSCATAKYMIIALTFEIDADGSWQLGGIMMLVFFVLCVLCVVGL